MGKKWKEWQTLFWGAPKSLQMVTAAMKLRRLLLGRKVMTNLDSIFKSRDIALSTKVHLVKVMVFLVMYVCESWTIKKAEHRRIDDFELWYWIRLFESPLDCKEIQPVNPRKKKSVLSIHCKDWCWSLNSNNLAIWCEELTRGKDLDAGKDWRPEEKGMTEDEMVGWHHWHHGHEFEEGPGIDDGQGSLVGCSPWGCQVRHNWATELHWTEKWL